MKQKLKNKKTRQGKNLRQQLIETKKELFKIKNKVKKPVYANRKLNLSILDASKRRQHQKIICQKELLSELATTLQTFDESTITELDTNLPGCKGVYGEIRLAKIDFMGISCAKKLIRGSFSDVRAEALVMHHVSGNACFPYFFGLQNPGALIMEFISGKKNFSAPPTTLSSLLGKKILFKKDWYSVCRQLVDGLSFLHGKGVLHNDLHGKNILIRHTKCPCIIDFGKATLISSPLVYDIEPDSKEQKLFNSVHKHLAYELRNEPNSPQTTQTDVYSLGYNFKNICKYEGLKDLSTLSTKMTIPNPIHRFDLIDCSVHLLKIL